MKDRIYELIRFSIVGVLATAIHYGIYLLFNLALGANLSYTIGYIISFACNFILTSYFTFKTKPTKKKGFGFIFSHLVNYLLQLAFLNIFIFIGVNAKWAPIPTWSITIPINFLLVRYFIKK